MMQRHLFALSFIQVMNNGRSGPGTGFSEEFAAALGRRSLQKLRGQVGLDGCMPFVRSWR
jgi:hypothetical protein